MRFERSRERKGWLPEVLLVLLVGCFVVTVWVAQRIRGYVFALPWWLKSWAVMLLCLKIRDNRLDAREVDEAGGPRAPVPRKLDGERGGDGAEKAATLNILHL